MRENNNELIREQLILQGNLWKLAFISISCLLRKNPWGFFKWPRLFILNSCLHLCSVYPRQRIGNKMSSWKRVWRIFSCEKQASGWSSFRISQVSNTSRRWGNVDVKFSSLFKYSEQQNVHMNTGTVMSVNRLDPVMLRWRAVRQLSYQLCKRHVLRMSMERLSRSLQGEPQMVLQEWGKKLQGLIIEWWYENGVELWSDQKCSG